MTNTLKALAEAATLIERLEAATGADRELDWLIADALGEIPKHTLREIGFDYDWYRNPGQFSLWKANDSEGRNVSVWTPNERTASIDAALTLLPPGWIWRYVPNKRVAHTVSVACDTEHGGHVAECDSSPAIAICLASMRARAALIGKAQ